jgi:hypothetical protein
MGLQSHQFNGKKVNGEHSLIMLVYNIKRSINILGVPDLIAKLKMELTLQGKSLVLLKTKYIKLQLDFIIKLNLQPKKSLLKGLI